MISRETTKITNPATITININRALIPLYLINHITKTLGWTPKLKSRALGLIQGRRHSLSEIPILPTFLKEHLESQKAQYASQ